jgi:hypothetical protein
LGDHKNRVKEKSYKEDVHKNTLSIKMKKKIS